MSLGIFQWLTAPEQNIRYAVTNRAKRTQTIENPYERDYALSKKMIRKITSFGMQFDTLFNLLGTLHNHGDFATWHLSLSCSRPNLSQHSSAIRR